MSYWDSSCRKCEAAMSENAEFLKMQADRCSRLATQVTDSTLAKTLRAVAADYREQAASQARQRQQERFRSTLE